MTRRKFAFECERMTPLERKVMSSGRKMPKPRWSNAVRSDCAAGHRHASKMESRVCNRLTLEAAADGFTLFQQPRFPLLAIAPKENGKAEVFSPDFAIWSGGKLTRIVEAKSKTRVSRDYSLRARAFESTYGVKVEVVDR